MNAKEMFGKLGLEYCSIDYKKNEIIGIQHSNAYGTWIKISKKYIEYVENFDCSRLPLKFIKPINKQLEELGWLDE